MEYRRLGRTGLQASVLGVGGGYIMLLEERRATDLYRRALELGLNYFDGRYGHTSKSLAPAIREVRERCIVVTKTAETTAGEAMRRIEEDLAELETDYLDVFFLRCYSHDMLQAHLAPGGAFEGLRRAREQGKIRFIGLANHGMPSVATAAIEADLVDVVIFPLNIVRREAFDALIPAAQKHDVGLVVMKPLDVGKIPADIGLRWLRNQPIHTMVPGVSSIEQLEADVVAMERPPALSTGEEREIEYWQQRLDQQACRICDDICQPVCEAGLPIAWMIHHDVLYEHYRNLGLHDLLEYPLAAWARDTAADHFTGRLALVESCTHCSRCEEVCPHHLPIMQMLDQMREDHLALLEAIKERGWPAAHGGDSPVFAAVPKSRGR